MKQLRVAFHCLILAATAPAPAAVQGDARSFHGMCDASAVVALDARHFVVANDEDNVLRVYRLTQTSAPVWEQDFSRFLEVGADSPETDLEGAARIGDLIYWITSHGRNAEGKERRSRRRFFATRIVPTAEAFALVPEGKPYKRLQRALLEDAQLARFNLAEAAKLAPKLEGAFDIEGLAATPDGRLLVGFRSPIPGGRALVVPLQNPREVISGAEPRLGEPVLLDLGGRGIRAMCLSGSGEKLMVIAGAPGSGLNFRLYEWFAGKPPVQVPVHFGDFAAEGISPSLEPGKPGWLCVSDDGTRKIGDCDCRTLPEAAQRRFRLFRIE